MVRWSVWIATVAVFGITWIYRWLTVDFTNDHFVHLTRARQILIGELPVRDFFDPGLPLQYYASAAALYLSGQNMLGEAILTVTLVALGAALTFYLAARTSRSTTLALLATIVTVVVFPRLYNYPKVFLYPLALVLIWQYAARRTTASAMALACLTAVAMLLRLDHGLYIGAASGLALLLANVDRLRVFPAIAIRFAAVVVLLLLPFLVFVQWTAGLPAFVSSTLTGRTTLTTARVLAVPFSLDRQQPWIAIDPPSHPRISVRWMPGMSDAERRERETRYALQEGTGDGGTWSYVLGDTRRESIEALVRDPLVADTHNIDREAFRPIVSETWIQRARNLVPPLRLRIAPRVLTPGNAMAWLYYATVLVPVVALLVLLVQWRRGTLTPFDVATIGTAAVLCLVIHQTLIRNSPDSRLPDVAGATAVLGAWIAGLAWRTGRNTVRVAVAVLGAITLWSAAAFGETGERFVTSGVPAGPSAVLDRMREVTRLVQMRPIEWYAPEGSTGIRGLTRYVLECTHPSDSVLAGGFEPQVAFYAERPFAGRQVFLKEGWHSSEKEQLAMIERMRQQRVPIVLFSMVTEEELRRGFALVYRYVHENYREAARAEFDGDREFSVLVNNRLEPRSTYQALGLPCYR